MPRILHPVVFAVLVCAALALHAQDAPAPAPPKPEDAIAAFRIAVDTLLQQRSEHQQFLFTLEMDETYSTPEGLFLGRESNKFDILFIAGKPYSRLIEKDGKPLTQKEAAEEAKKYNKALANHNSFSISDHFSHTVHGIEFDLKDVQSSYTLRYVGWQVIDGRRLWRIEAFPPPPSATVTLHQVKVTFWLDEQTKNIVRDDSLLLQNNDQLLSGSHDSEEYIQVDGISCVSHATAHIEMLSGHVIDVEDIFTNYRKFTSTTKILPGSETVVP
jgi:hypothetical protein